MKTKSEKNGLLTASIVVTVISVLGKVFGFARDAVIAAFFGADWRTDAFFFAQSMPGIMFPAVCNSFSTAFLTTYVSKSVENEKQADEYASKSISACVCLAIVLSIIAIIITPIIVPIFAPGFSGEQAILAQQLTRISMAAFVLIMIQYMLDSLLSAKKFFYRAQIAALLYNVTITGIMIVFGRGKSIEFLTFTVVVGQIIQIIALILFAKSSFTFHAKIYLYDKEIKKLFSLALPIILGNGIVQINNIVDKVLSSFMGEGAMSALSYANTLNRFVTSIVITTIVTVVYPYLTDNYSRGREEVYSSILRKSITVAVIVLAPISIITLMCSHDIVTIVYQRGGFTQTASELTAYALKYYGLMFVFFAIQEIVTRAFYAMKDTKTPLKTAAIAIFSNAVLSVVFAFGFRMGLAGIALGTTISTLVAAILLVRALNKRVASLSVFEVGSSIIQCIISSFFIVGMIVILRERMSSLNVIIRFLLITFISCLVYFILLYVLKNKEVHEIVQIIKTKLNQKYKRKSDTTTQ